MSIGTSVSSLFVAGHGQLERTRTLVGSGDDSVERDQRRRAFLHRLLVFSATLDRSACRILAQHGVDSLPQAMSILGDERAGDVLVFLSTTPLYLHRGDKSCVTINMTTATLLATSASSFSDIDESVLQAELRTIERHKTRAVLAVLVSLNAMVDRARLSSDAPDYLELSDDEMALLVPAVRFIVEVLKRDRGVDGLAFSLGAHLTTSAPTLALQVGFDVDAHSPLAVVPGNTEFTRLVSDGVRRCHDGWAKTRPFVPIAHIVESSRIRSTTAHSDAEEVDTVDYDDDETAPKRTKTAGLMRSSTEAE